MRATARDMRIYIWSKFWPSLFDQNTWTSMARIIETWKGCKRNQNNSYVDIVAKKLLKYLLHLFSLTDSTPWANMTSITFAIKSLVCILPRDRCTVSKPLGSSYSSWFTMKAVRQNPKSYWDFEMGSDPLSWLFLKILMGRYYLFWLATKYLLTMSRYCLVNGSPNIMYVLCVTATADGRYYHLFAE